MALAFDSLWIREPNLLVPGQKPIGHVKLGNLPLPPQCIAYVPCTERHGEIIHNLVTGEQATLEVTNAAVRLGRGYTDLGAFITNIGTSAKNEVGLRFDNVSITTGDSLTVLAGVNIVSTSADLGLFSLSATQYPGSWLDTSGGNLRLSAYTTYSSFNITTAGLRTVGITWASDGSVQFIDNGFIVDTASRSLSIAATPALYLGCTGSSAIKGSSTSVYGATMLNGAYLWFAAFKRVLSAAEINSVCRDPYQFLVPA